MAIINNGKKITIIGSPKKEPEKIVKKVNKTTKTTKEDKTIKSKEGK